jgi:hypothetical protein
LIYSATKMPKAGYWSAPRAARVIGAQTVTALSKQHWKNSNPRSSIYVITDNFHQVIKPALRNRLGQFREDTKIGFQQAFTQLLRYFRSQTCDVQLAVDAQAESIEIRRTKTHPAVVNSRLDMREPRLQVHPNAVLQHPPVWQIRRPARAPAASRYGLRIRRVK